MCLRPYRIKNPNYCRQTYSLHNGDIIPKPVELNSQQQFIDVPCCKCPECRGTYFNSILQRGIVESLSSYVYFVTLTYDDKHIPSLQLPEGDIVYYPDYSHIQNLFKRLRNYHILDREFRYLCATEYGDKRHRPHFHLLIFVERFPDDDLRVVPYIYERLLFDNIRKYYSVNIGTRKNPLYEPLFTYRRVNTPNGVRTNYFVKYVEPTDNYKQSFTDTSILIKTIRYTLGYVIKSSRFDTYLLSKLENLHDILLRSKLKNLLISKLRFSKGFGLGFCYGRQYTQKSLVNVSYATSIYSTLSDIDFNYFDTYFRDINDLLIYISLGGFISLSDLRNNLSQDKFYHFIYLSKAFPNYINYIQHRFCSKRQLDCISYHFRFLHPRSYVMHKECTNSNIVLVESYIRDGINQGIKQKLPFLAFPLVSSQSFMPLCKFYRERFTTHQDTLNMYSSIGVRNYDEWLSLFTKYVRLNKSSIEKSNDLTHESELLQYSKSSAQPIVIEELLKTC